MRINKSMKLKYVFVICIVLFFGYIGYQDLANTNVATAERYATAALADASKDTAASGTKTSSYYGAKRAQIALAEYRLGVSESTRGCNCGPIVDKYTGGLRAQWCTMFASWVANEAGYPLINEKTHSWRIENSRDFAANLQANGTWYSREEVIKNNIQPRIGDFIVSWRGDFEDNLGHVDIVVSPGSSAGSAGLVGGNLKDNVKYREFPYLEYYGFLGFGRPEKD